jgi:hypothetical protein
MKAPTAHFRLTPARGKKMPDLGEDPLELVEELVWFPRNIDRGPDRRNKRAINRSGTCFFSGYYRLFYLRLSGSLGKEGPEAFPSSQVRLPWRFHLRTCEAWTICCVND